MNSFLDKGLTVKRSRRLHRLKSADWRVGCKGYFLGALLQLTQPIWGGKVLSQALQRFFFCLGVKRAFLKIDSHMQALIVDLAGVGGGFVFQFYDGVVTKTGIE